MVSLKDVRISNSRFMAKSPGMVALFVGGTSGIGKGTLKQFTKFANAPKLYIIGRSQSSATPLLNELQSLNPQGTFIFIESEISLIKKVDIVCEEIKEKEQKLDLIFLSPGYLSLEGRHETSEGVDILSSLNYYARLRIVHNLLPLLTASRNPRIVSVLAGGKERSLDINDLELHNNPTFLTRVNTSTTQTTLAFEELAKSYPMITFCHVYPGFVNTGQLDRFMLTAQGIWTLPAMVARWTVIPVLNLFGRTIEEAGERGLFVATSAKYPPAEPKYPEEVGVTLPEGVDVAKSSVVKDGKGNGVYRLDNYDESVENEIESDKVLAGYRLEEVGKTIWEKTTAVWDRALERA